MNLGKTIYELRKKKNMTQEELAAELGVTAAAVSKWEKGYTLPDLLMLCALADYFEVTTDELLGRTLEKRYAIIGAGTRELGEKIKVLAAEHGITAKAVFYNKEDAAAAIREDPEVTCLIMGFHGNQFPDLSFDLGSREITLYLSLSDTEQEILNALHDSLHSNH